MFEADDLVWSTELEQTMTVAYGSPGHKWFCWFHPRPSGGCWRPEADLSLYEPNPEAYPVTKSGKVLTPEDFERLADEAERGYDVPDRPLNNLLLWVDDRGDSHML